MNKAHGILEALGMSGLCITIIHLMSSEGERNTTNYAVHTHVCAEWRHSLQGTTCRIVDDGHKYFTQFVTKGLLVHFECTQFAALNTFKSRQYPKFRPMLSDYVRILCGLLVSTESMKGQVEGDS